ncbi:MAG: crotonase/enoyl-CoA hydratase family protein [Gammaproteobacteria bacterium]|nr:crotonase/enoyl-CoA hydratase family protein [Gammaproteobacteria bacterium]
MADLIYEKFDNGVVILTMNRPRRKNSLSPEMLCRLVDAWEDFDADADLRVAILTGSCEAKAFCAGADLGLLVPLLTGAREPQDKWDERLLADPDILYRALQRNNPTYKPVIAAINGLAFAGGTEFIQGTDIRLAVPGASFGLTEVKMGLAPGGGSLTRLIRQMPYAKAMHILLTGEPLTAEEALEIGFINEIVVADKLMDHARKLADQIAANGPLAVQACKEAVVRTSGLALDQAYLIEDEIARAILQTEDAVEGPRAFMEKRKPVFKAR